MKDPKIKTKVVHSQSKAAWNVVATSLGYKYKIARVPYVISTNEEFCNKERNEAYEHAEFISYCFNHSDDIVSSPI